MKITKSDIEVAYKRIKELLPPTSLVRNVWLSQKYHCNVYLKLENLQPVGSFKLRGAINKISSLTTEEMKKGVMAVSAGNHAQGVAWAAAHFGVPATIIMPKTSPLVKIMNTEELGAKVLLEGENVDECFQFAEDFLAQNDLTYIHPFCDPHVIAGQASLGMELAKQLPHIDHVFCSIGGGGLLAGVASALKVQKVAATTHGVQAMGANSMIRSLISQHLQESEAVETFADGIKVKRPRPEMFQLLQNLVDETHQVSDARIAKAVLDLMEKARIISEGAGAITLAAFDKAYHKNPEFYKGKNIVLVISGGNIDINVIDRILGQGLVESRRWLDIKLLLKDRPGNLNLLTSLVFNQGANILQVEHKRDVKDLALTDSVVEVLIETKGAHHSEEIFKVIKKHFQIMP